MSWSELERFVGDVEADVALQRALKYCRSRKELILAAMRLGYPIMRIDLQRARQEELLEARELGLLLNAVLMDLCIPAALRPRRCTSHRYRPGG
jgi:hypothetical protein